MKRIIFACVFSAFALSSVMIWANETDACARKIAFERLSALNNGIQESSLVKAEILSGPENVTVYNAKDNMGFVIMSDNAENPVVLGYSDEGNFDIDNMPAPLADMLENVSFVNNADSRGKASVKPLIPCKWGQGAPYNTKLQKLTNSSFTGCVPTALCQVMKYYRYPASGSIVGKYNYEGKTHTYDLTTVNFEWEKMRDVYEDLNYTQEEGDAVAELMFGATLSLPMSHSVLPFGSSPLHAAEAVALEHYFGYDSGMRHLIHDYFNDETWENIIYYELSQSRPVLFSGYSTDSYGVVGHSFICDGYEDGYYHFNWGWDGSGNGYYSLALLQYRDDQNIFMPYAFGQSITIGICPAGRNLTPNPFVLSDPILRIDSDFDENFSYCLESVDAFVGEIGVKISSSDDVVKTYKTNDLEVSSRYPQSCSLNISAVTGLPDGDYIVTPVYRKNRTLNWIDMLVPINKIHYMNLKVANGKYTYVKGEKPKNAYKVRVTAFAPVDVAYSKEECIFKVIVENSGDMSFYQGVDIDCYDKKGEYAGLCSTMLTAHHMLPSQETVNRVYVNLLPGTYDVVFKDVDGNILSDVFNLEVKSRESGILDVVSQDIEIEVRERKIHIKNCKCEPAVSNVYGKTFTGYMDNGSYTVDVPVVGIYIVKVGHIAQKVIVD